MNAHTTTDQATAEQGDMNRTGPPSLENKVVVITGAGRGIGRAVALLAAQEGARVVVNDIGGASDGTGSDSGPARQVVNEIEEAGGEAAVNTASVDDPEGAESIIHSALDSFGSVDVVINNAGILRDKIFHHMTTEEFRAVIGVHLLGSFFVSRAAAKHFREQEHGTFVHFTSTSGLIGNVGQANYAAAKMGIVGLSKSIALDMARFNVRSNCIAPFAWSRLIATIPTETEADLARVERMKLMTPEKIAPLVAFLASDRSEGITGQIFAVRKNEIFLMSQPRPIRSIHDSDGWTTEKIAERLPSAFRSSFVPNEGSPDVFSGEPI
jgi:NAD(P)-dependent dehydrogenase (short-subunit alcohol dehydrogenase family)